MADNPGGRRMSKRAEYVAKSVEVNKKEKPAPKDANDKDPDFKPMQVADIPEYDPNRNRRLSKLEMDEMKQKFDNQMQALIENPQQARRSFIAEDLIKKQEEKKTDLNTIAAQLVKAKEEKEDEKEELPETIIDETFKDSNQWEKTIEYLSKTKLKVRWMFLIKKLIDESHSIEFIHNRGDNDKSKTKRKILIDGQEVLSEESDKIEYTQLFGGNVYIISIKYNDENENDNVFNYDLNINNKMHKQSYDEWKKKKNN
eukprot:304399_1